MKTILVPVDFSANSTTAARYALELAGQIKASIVLFNAYSLPVLISEVPVQTFSEEEIRQASLKQLGKLATLLNRNNKTGIPIKISASYGDAVDGIVNKAEKSKADVIVMGAKGDAGIMPRLFGNTTTGVIRKSEIPVLAVPAHTRYKPVQNVLVACDNGKSLTDPVINTVKKLADTLNARLALIRVVHIGQFLTTGPGLENQRHVDKQLADTPHTFGYDINTEAQDGIAHAAKQIKPDMLVLISHKRDFFGRIFHGTIRNTLSLTKKPVFIIPDSIKKKRAERLFEPTIVKTAAHA